MRKVAQIFVAFSEKLNFNKTENRLHKSVGEGLENENKEEII